MLTICATGGLDIVAEESLVKLAQYSDKCCLIHALDDLNATTPGFDPELLPTLLSLRRVFSRISQPAQDFICLCMQQRFSDKELAQLSPSNKRIQKAVSAQDLISNAWLNEAPAKKPSDTQALGIANTSDS